MSFPFFCFKIFFSELIIDESSFNFKKLKVKIIYTCGKIFKVDKMCEMKNRSLPSLLCPPPLVPLPRDNSVWCNLPANANSILHIYAPCVFHLILYFRDVSLFAPGELPDSFHCYMSSFLIV